jgi:hypothetical protein
MRLHAQSEDMGHNLPTLEDPQKSHCSIGLEASPKFLQNLTSAFNFALASPILQKSPRQMSGELGA